MTLTAKQQAQEIIKRSVRNGGDAIRVTVPSDVEWELCTMDDCKRKVAYDDGVHLRGTSWYVIVARESK